MLSEKKFSNFLTSVLVLFIGISITFIVGILYGILSKTMTDKFHHQLQAQQSDLVMVIHDRFYYLETKLQELSFNNAMRVNLMLGVKSQLREIMEEQYPSSNGAFFLVFDKDESSFIPGLPENYKDLYTNLIGLNGDDKVVEHRFGSIGEKKSLSYFSAPIKRKNEHLGTAVLLYNISQDFRFWDRIDSYPISRLLIEDKGHLFDLRSGEKVCPTDHISNGHFKVPSESQVLELLPDESLIPLKGFPGLFLAASSKPLQEEKRVLIIILIILCVVILFLTFLISFFIARRVSDPLDCLANQAIEIAQKPSNLFLHEEKIRYTEFGKLARAFNHVLQSLLETQWKLEKKAKQELDASEERYKLTVEAAPDSITITRLKDGCYLQINEAFHKSLGYTVEEVIGKTPFDLNLFVNPKDREKFIKILKEKGEINGLELKFRRKDGSIIDTLFSGRKIYFAGEECLVAIVTDYTERKRAEEDIKRSKETLQHILDSMPFGVTIIGKDKTIRHVNKSALNLIGYESEDEILGKICHATICPNEEGKCPIFDLGKQVDRNERFIITKDGMKIPILKSAIPVELDTEEVLIEAFFDLTKFIKAEEEKKQLETRLQRAQKMEAIGTLAGGVAHDLNNILSGLVSYPELMLMDVPQESPLIKSILTIQKSGEKAAAIVQDLLTLARRGVSATEVVNLNNIILDYLKSPEYKKLKSYHPLVQVNMDLEEDLLNILGSNVHLSKTVMNLVSNAAEAMPNGGEINISTKNSYIDLPFGAYDDIEEGDYAILTVTDTGVGIAQEDKERIFEPFYTKKKMGRSGTGLGMAVVWGTVKDHNGYIDVQSRQGSGTSFKLYFPVTREKPSQAEPKLSIEQYMGKGESILIVDDMEEQRRIAKEILTKLRYSVQSVSSGEEAIEYLKTHSADLLILDMIMDTGIDGLETYRKILKIYPKQKAIIASGFSETTRVREAQRLGAGAYIKKPYLIEKIGVAVAKELQR